MDSGIILADINLLKSELQNPQEKSFDSLDGGQRLIESQVEPPIGGDETKKPFDLERDEDGVLHIVRCVFMSDGELYELEDREIPEGTEWIWLKTVSECQNSEDEKSHDLELKHSIEFEQGAKIGQNEIWLPIYRLTDDLEIEIDFRACMKETGLKTRTMTCVVPVVFSPGDSSYNQTLYPKYKIRACNDIELSWATLMLGNDGEYYIFQDGKYVKISNKGNGDGSGGGESGGGDTSGYSGAVVVATNPRYDDGSHQLLYTPVSMKYEKGLLKSIETGSETVIAQAVEESA